MSLGSPTRRSGSDAAVLASMAAFRAGSMWSKRSVSQKPGERQLTRSRGPRSSASDRVRPSNAPFTVASGAEFTPGRRLSTPATKTTAPPSARRGAIYLAACHAVQNLDSNMPRAASSSSVSTAPCGARPAAETTKLSHASGASSAANASTAAASLASRSLISTASSAAPVALRISALARSRRSASREASSARPPPSTHARAAALPMPLLPPITIAFGAASAAAHCSIMTSRIFCALLQSDHSAPR
mmetsp:Transcript_23495/g.70422  ORF Transcript_23495/g.70422 Transcript_23495/m.70422 type:complete len:246 (-) Transcript_23495:2-739(-)